MTVWVPLAGDLGHFGFHLQIMKIKAGQTPCLTCGYSGRGDWIRTSDPLLPKVPDLTPISALTCLFSPELSPTYPMATCGFSRDVGCLGSGIYISKLQVFQSHRTRNRDKKRAAPTHGDGPDCTSACFPEGTALLPSGRRCATPNPKQPAPRMRVPRCRGAEKQRVCICIVTPARVCVARP